MSIFASVKYIPYENSQQCMAALPSIEAIDYFFARQILFSQQQVASALNQMQYQEVFHVLLALSQYQRRGSVCVALSTLANMYFWTNDSGNNETEVVNNSSTIEALTTSRSESGTHDSDSFSQGFQFSAIDILQSMLDIFIAGLPENTYLVLEESRLYSKRYWHYEHALCQYIAVSLSQANIHQRLFKLTTQQSLVTKTMGLLFPFPAVIKGVPDFQQLSVLNSLGLPFSIITGGAGTGKTYTITRLAILISIVNAVPIDAIEMAAPTGKAANRMAQSLNDELEKLALIPELTHICEQLSELQPKTINRLLKTNPTTGKSAYSTQRPLSAQLVIIDETSMIDISLMNKLIDSLAMGTQLILVGDPNQLPSVETGCLLADLVAHPFGSLSKEQWQSLYSIYPPLFAGDTFAAQHLISDSAQSKGIVNKLVGMQRSHQQIDLFSKAILASNTTEALSLSHSLANSNGVGLELQSANAEVQILPLLSQYENQGINTKQALEKVLADKIVPNLFDLFTASSPQEGFIALKKYALLTPFRKSYFGTESLNYLIERQLSFHFDWVMPNKLYKCKPIMILQNDYQLSLFNGDIGIIWDTNEKELMAYFMVNKKLVAYPVYNLPAIDTNYAMTIHKTQGSEFERVDIILPHSDTDFLNKQLLYTGVTRAQKSVRIFSSLYTFKQTLTNSADRISGIESRLSLAFENEDNGK
ncbi:MAG: exodeoxyribonuclease V alpha subunit [Glaciecola sp.]|jgi:exodeoxyribonuclease V alpha subunit